MTIVSQEEMERRRRDKAKAKEKKRNRYQWQSAGVSPDDFQSYMPMHKYFFAPTRDLWPATSVNSRLPPVLINPDAYPDEHMYVPASAWLDRNRPVEQMTWMPGELVIIENRVVAEGSFIERQGSRIFNTYLGPRCEVGDAARAGPWLEHVRRVYPTDADHILKWLAHRVQRPGEKINHALLLGGAPGVGKDTILIPVSYAVGRWNFQEISPPQLLGRFNDFVCSVILRINEARDLGDVTSYAFYEHCKTLVAAPPETLRVDKKGLQEYRVPNVVGVIITSNYKTDGCYLPPDDRRHYVAWSDLPAAGEEGALSAEYFEKLYRWYDEEAGICHVAAWLAEHSLTGFYPKAPPPRTPAFWEIVDAQRGTEDSEIADAIDEMTAGEEARGKAGLFAFTTDKLKGAAQEPLRTWLSEKKNRRQVPKLLERVGYTRVNNPNANDRLWKINGRRQAIYGLRRLSEKTRLDEAHKIATR